MEKILIIQTGGTIDKDYPKSIAGYAFEIGESAAAKICERVMSSESIHVVTSCKKDSQEISEQDRKDLYDLCTSASETRILITHGTDTMIQTAQYLASIRGKTIVLTGSFKPETFKDSDAEFNVGMALGALQCMHSPGVYVVMSGKVFASGNVRRNEITGAFESKS